MMQNDKIMDTEFKLNGSSYEALIAEAERNLQWVLPADYKKFIRQSNGGEGFVGENYLVLWSVEELSQFNQEYQVKEYAPGLILFGSDGGGEGYAFDTRSENAPIVQVPFIGMELRYARSIAANFDEFLEKLKE